MNSPIHDFNFLVLDVGTNLNTGMKSASVPTPSASFVSRLRRMNHESLGSSNSYLKLIFQIPSNQGEWPHPRAQSSSRKWNSYTTQSLYSYIIFVWKICLKSHASNKWENIRCPRKSRYERICVNMTFLNQQSMNNAFCSIPRSY